MREIKQFYSLNFDTIKRKKEDIKYLVFHYTGMKSEKSAIKRLTDIKSKVSCHYFIKKNGSIINMVPDMYVSWHAGISFWKNFKGINKYSIGIEIQNSGHQYGYEYFNKRQIYSIKYLSLKLAKKYNLKNKHFLGHSDVATERKKDPGEKFPWQYLSKYKIGIWHDLTGENQKFRHVKVIDKEKNLFNLYLRKIGYCLKINRSKDCNYAIKAFQRRFRPEIINGKVDKECLEIAKNLLKRGLN